MYQLEQAEKINDYSVPKDHWLFRTKREAFDKINFLMKTSKVLNATHENGVDTYEFSKYIFTITIREDLADT